ncbi:hypothetical protein H6F75_05655 [Nodosilinea sp. FACHB-131]|uniref:hypothetical protein n=1 Tax=Leptolyngbya subtilissima TaxID=1346803 RepID=UPI0016831A71|nr:hypothetical protein [Nodosilinea sp. FACHB-131]
MAGIIRGVRWIIIGVGLSLYWPGFLLSLVLVLLVTGMLNFRRGKHTFADVI